MTIEEYEKVILHQLELANDCEEVGDIINMSVERMRGKNLSETLIENYIEELRERLEQLPKSAFDSIHWCNIRFAIIHLKKISSNNKV